VPPELQGDPRYQEYLHCLRTSSGPKYDPQGALQNAPQGAPQYAPAPVVRHQPINASDFVPAMAGHPFVEQALANMPIDPQQRQVLHGSVDEVFKQVANNFRGNNVAVAMAFTYATANGTITGTDPNEQQIREAILNVNDVLAQDQNFSRMTAVQKQTAADSLIFQSAMILVLRNMGQQDPGAKQKSIDLAHIVRKQLTGS
jgi:hypothetical protein